MKKVTFESIAKHLQSASKTLAGMVLQYARQCSITAKSDSKAKREWRTALGDGVRKACGLSKDDPKWATYNSMISRACVSAGLKTGNRNGSGGELSDSRKERGQNILAALSALFKGVSKDDRIKALKAAIAVLRAK